MTLWTFTLDVTYCVTPSCLAPAAPSGHVGMNVHTCHYKHPSVQHINRRASNVPYCYSSSLCSSSRKTCIGKPPFLNSAYFFSRSIAFPRTSLASASLFANHMIEPSCQTLYGCRSRSGLHSTPVYLPIFVLIAFLARGRTKLGEEITLLKGRYQACLPLALLNLSSQLQGFRYVYLGLLGH